MNPWNVYSDCDFDDESVWFIKNDFWAERVI